LVFTLRLNLTWLDVLNLKKILEVVLSWLDGQQEFASELTFANRIRALGLLPVLFLQLLE